MNIKKQEGVVLGFQPALSALHTGRQATGRGYATEGRGKGLDFFFIYHPIHR